MSFAGTPLGQGRRLDHNTFLGKLPSTDRQIPPSYSFGAPALGSRSPPKPTAPSARERPAPATDHDDGTLTTRPEKWTVRDTSVGIASAFHQAADTMSNHHNSSWAAASGSRTGVVPRSTSVEYETATANKPRFAPPPKRLNSNSSILTNRPLAKTVSTTIVPDSEGEDNGNTSGNANLSRAKSPLHSLADSASQSLKGLTMYVRQRSQEPSIENVNGSYDYSNEEREFQNQNKRKAAHKRGGISADNKAYKPTTSDLEDSDEDFEDGDGQRRRKTKKKDAGRVNTLPTIGESRQRKKKRRSNAPRAAGQQESEEEEEEQEHNSARGSQHGSFTLQPSRQPSALHSIPNAEPVDISTDLSMDLDGLPHIPEEMEDSREKPQTRRRAASVGVGAKLGKGFNSTFHGIRGIFNGSNAMISALFWLCGRVLGTMLNTVVKTPAGWFLRGSFNGFIRYLVVGLTIMGAWYFLQEPITSMTPSFNGRTTYRPPEAPAADISELNTRLLSIESALSSLVRESEKTRSQVDGESRLHAEVAHKVGSLESKLQREKARAIEADEQHREAASRTIQALRKEVEVIQAQVQSRPASPSTEGSNDEEARAKLKVLEDRLGSVEGGVKEALEIGKAGAKAGSAVAGLSWINGLDKKGLTIKSSDGKDVTGLIAHMVKSAISIQTKDTLAKPDYALSSTGGRVIPAHTSPTVEIMIPEGGTGIGRPPVTALHHELHAGHCWPFAGSTGRLGVALAAPIYVSEVTIDHVPREVAHDMRTAPRMMDVWGQIDGKDNVEKIAKWREEKARKRDEALQRGEAVEEEVHPKEFPAKLWVKIASLAYNIYGPDPIQTFPVFEEIRALGVDFGIVNLQVLNNWGREDYTCLYRFRVHGELRRPHPAPLSEDVLLHSS